MHRCTEMRLLSKSSSRAFYPVDRSARRSDIQIAFVICHLLQVQQVIGADAIYSTAAGQLPTRTNISCLCLQTSLPFSDATGWYLRTTAVMWMEEGFNFGEDEIAEKNPAQYQLYSTHEV